MKHYARNSLTTISGMKVAGVNGRIRVIIPLKNITGVRAAFLNADTSIGYLNIDKTAWRMLRFK